MNGFWHALARVNARYLSIGAAALLGLTLLAWLTSMGPPRSRETTDVPPPSGAAAVAEEGAAPAGDGPADGAAPNPFQSDHLSELVALSDEGLLRWNAPASPPREAQPESPPAEAAEEPAPPPEPRTVKLLYRGMITRTDGTTVAMIEQGDEGRPASHAAGVSFIDGIRITNIGRSQVEVTVGEETVTLRRGTLMELEY